MDADVAALQRFAEVPYVIEAPAPRPDAAIPAMTALAAATRAKVVLDDSKGPVDPAYTAIVEDIRAQIASQVEAKDRYRIEVLDIGAGNLDKELARASESLRGARKNLDVAYKGMGGAFTFLLQEKPDRTACVVVGFKPEVTFAKVAEESAGVRSVKARDLTDKDYHRITLWHEVGHCLLGTDEAQADVFAALMAVRFTSLSKQGLSVYAAFREVNEVITVDLKDNHIMSRPLWAVAERAEALRADPDFMAMGMQEIASVAKQFVAKEGPKPQDEAHIIAMRAAYRVAAKERLHKLPGGGRPVAFFRWAKESASALPEIARLVELEHALKAEQAEVSPPAGRRTAEDLKASLAGLKARGDVTSGKMLAAVSARIPVAVEGKMKAEKWASINPYKFETSAHARFVSPATIDRAAEDDPEPTGPRF